MIKGYYFKQNFINTPSRRTVCIKGKGEGGGGGGGGTTLTSSTKQSYCYLEDILSID